MEPLEFHSRLNSKKKKSLFKKILRYGLLISLFSAFAVVVGSFTGNLAGVSTRVLIKAYHDYQFDITQERARDLTVKVDILHLRKNQQFHVRATGVIIKPGQNGKSRILTNGHVCDAASILPDPISRLAQLTEEQSLMLPIEGSVITEDQRSWPMNRILLHEEWPDLCVIELKVRLPIKDFADVAEVGPEFEEELLSIGHPGGDVKLAQRGKYQGLSVAGFPARGLNPRSFARRVELIKKINQLDERIRMTQFLMDLVFFTPSPVLVRELQLARLQMFLKTLQKQLQKLEGDLSALRQSLRAPSATVHIWSMGGASGSGIWNRQGKLVAILWGSYVGGSNLAFCVPLYSLHRFLHKLPK